MEEVHGHYDGQGLKGALWTLAGTSIAGVAQRLVNGGFGAGGYGAMGAMQTAALAVDAAKDARIAKLESDAETDRKLVEVYKTLAASDTRQANELRSLEKRVTALEYENARLGMLVGRITKTVVPTDAICPEVMPRYNSWTAPTNVAPATQAAA